MFPFLYLFKDVTEGFVGCLNNLRLREKMIGRWKQNKDVIPCSEMVEPGYFFGPGGGSIMVSNLFISFIPHKRQLFEYEPVCIVSRLSISNRCTGNSELDLILILQ